MQDAAEAVEFTPGDRGDRPPEELLVGPGRMPPVGVGDRVRRQVRAVQQSGQGFVAQPGVEQPEPPGRAGRGRPGQDRDQVQVAAALLVVPRAQ